MNVIVGRFKEVLFSVFPIVIVTLILNFTFVSLEIHELIRFILGALFIIIGLSIFLLGVDLGVTPIGNFMGSYLAKTNKITAVLIGGIILGFFITVAEPDLHILAGQIDFVTSGLISKIEIITVVSIGIGLFLSLGLIRIVYNISINKVITVIYLFIFILALFTSAEFLAISFDASGATTGALTVPFILALASGISVLKKDSKASEEDSFGLVGIMSAGAIISVMIMSIISKVDVVTGSIDNKLLQSNSIIATFIQKIPAVAFEAFFALMPLLGILLIFHRKAFNLSKRSLKRILKGMLYTFIGLVLFLAGVNAGFMDIGTIVGYELALLENKSIIIITAFILGLVTILAEPAVYVLVHQIEFVTSGYIRKNIVLGSLAVGVALATALSVIRVIVPGIQLWHYLLPGYIISIILTFFVPKLFIGIAFDSGGVASGPMTATFILAFAQGASDAVEGASILVDGFGIIAMVAMTPLITLQILGLIFKIKTKKKGMKLNGKHS